VPLAGWDATHSLALAALLEIQKLAGTPGTGGLYVASVAAVLSIVSVVCAWRRLTPVVAALAVAFCVAASAFATTFEVNNARNVAAVYLPAGSDWISGDATVVAGEGRTSVLEQFFWNRGAKRLALLPGSPAPDVFPTTRTHVTKDGMLAGIAGRVVLNEDGGALVPVAPLRTNGGWVSARTPQLAAQVGGLAGGWLSPSGQIDVYRAGVRFSVTAPEKMTVRLDGRHVHLPANVAVQVSLCAAGSFTYRFSSYGFLGLRQVSARATFPTWDAKRSCVGGGGRIRTSVG
jgi:hypothetical protein